MKCLSIRQPWALLVCVGAKAIENRARNTSYRGEIAIHAGCNKLAIEHFAQQDHWDESLREMFSYGSIIGTAEIYDAIEYDRNAFSDPWAEGPFCFLIRNPRLFVSPIPHKGRVNLYTLPDEVARIVEASKQHCVDTSEIRLRCSNAFPAGKIPSNLLPRSSRSAS
jgi:hypothetical protein